jgi:hypothetical protein
MQLVKTAKTKVKKYLEEDDLFEEKKRKEEVSITLI